MSEQRSASIPVIDLPSGSSGRTSKDSSPTRTGRTSTTSEQNGASKLNANLSPTRQPNGAFSTPSAAAVQRALSAQRASSINNDTSESARDRKQRSGNNTPQWPTSPRLKSPPPVSTRSISVRKSDNENQQTNTSTRRLAPVSAAELGAAMYIPQDSLKEAGSSQPILRAPGRGPSIQAGGLETVAENSVPTTPSVGPVASKDEDSKLHVSALDSTSDTRAYPTNKDPPNTVNDAMPKPAPEKNDAAPPSRAASASRPPTNLAKRSLPSLTGKNKTAVEPLRTMTLETETVSSNSQLLTDRGRDGGSVRAKPSTETIRPKKEKKKMSRKTPSLHAGMNSSKADIFEAKVASAVDEADSSDSDETFVYESNPPEPMHGRHHSRTPSANSMTSQVDHYGARGKYGVRNNNTAIGGKKSMKFSNSMYNQQVEAENAGDGNSSTRTANSTSRHHHIGRHGRNGHQSIIDTDSPFTHANKANSPRTPTARNSRPNSPRTSNGRLNLSRKSVTAGYDAYDDGADDERAPLIGSVRVNRNRHSRRPNGNQFRVMQFAEDEDPGCWPRRGGYCILGFIMTLACIAMALFIVILNRPLMDVEILRIQNVLASEQELMMDLLVQAVNTNLFTITVNELDVNIFAESPYVGTALDWQKHTSNGRSSFTERRRQQGLHRRTPSFWFPPFHRNDGVDEGTDPIDDPEPGTQKMLLGRIYEFDSPLVFDPYPIRRNPTSSVGEIRLQKPGNKTEAGGSERWERVLQHEFELIVRGVIRYQLPLSSSLRSAKIGGRIKVAPGGDSHDRSDDLETIAQLPP